MKAAILQAPGKFIIEEMPVPQLDIDEVLIQVKACGICTSELDIWEGKAKGLEFPRFIGHEVSGIVKETGQRVTSVKKGDHVAAWVQGKGYADYLAVKEQYLYKLKMVTLLVYALGEPIACSVNGVRKLDVQLNESVCIVGCGFMGLIMLQVFKIRGAGLIIAIDPREDILDLARKLGATHTFNPKKTDVVKSIKDLTNDRGVDIGVEATGKQETLDLTGNLVRMEGKLEIFGFHQGEARKVNWGLWNWMAFHIVNGHSRSPHLYLEGMKIGLELLETNKLDMAPLVTHRFSLTEINQGFETAVKKPKGFVKGVVVF